MMLKYLPIPIFVGITVTAGVLQGLHSGRWHTSREMERAVNGLQTLSLHQGDWRGESEEIDSRIMTRAEARGYVSARFRNVVTGAKVSMLIICGQPGPICVHTPEICYAGAGFEPAGNRFRKEISLPDGATIATWAMRFNSPQSSAPSIIEVNWLWFDGTNWRAPESARLTLSRYPVLYKVYVVRDVPADPVANAHDASVDFLQTYLPAIKKSFMASEMSE